MQGMDPVLPPLRRNWSEECEAERNIIEGREPQAAPFFNRVVEFDEEKEDYAAGPKGHGPLVQKEEDFYKPQPEIPGLVLPGIERRRSSKKKRSMAQIADIAEKASYLNVLIWGEATHVIGS